MAHGGECVGGPLTIAWSEVPIDLEQTHVALPLIAASTANAGAGGFGVRMPALGRDGALNEGFCGITNLVATIDSSSQ